MDVGERIKNLRKERDMSREELAVASGISFNTIANIERGADARTNTLRAIAQALGVSVDQLFIEEAIS